MGTTEQTEWMNVKKEYGRIGIPIYADESVAHESDIEFLSDFCHGVNMKLEKGGGLRSTLKVVRKAKMHNLSLWLGVMVGSALNANMSAQLAWVSGIGDWDGGLLVEADRFGGGFEWGKEGHMIFPSSQDPRHQDLHHDSHTGFGVFELH
jgi:L-alanine-DL-glutamate epimerase-like enolase superfamily enzyme